MVSNAGEEVQDEQTSDDLEVHGLVGTTGSLTEGPLLLWF